jgi:hypothetical protein
MICPFLKALILWSPNHEKNRHHPARAAGSLRIVEAAAAF